mmetsp:Transcript_19399/g.57713  ORF Transcript_19399/g.57713 Transcript_19399/m.57713 type:complete len:229 (-) Transcript_19399:44-730(-)
MCQRKTFVVESLSDEEGPNGSRCQYGLSIGPRQRPLVPLQIREHFEDVIISVVNRRRDGRLPRGLGGISSARQRSGRLFRNLDFELRAGRAPSAWALGATHGVVALGAVGHEIWAQKSAHQAHDRIARRPEWRPRLPFKRQRLPRRLTRKGWRRFHPAAWRDGSARASGGGGANVACPSLWSVPHGHCDGHPSSAGAVIRRRECRRHRLVAHRGRRRGYPDRRLQSAP